MKLKLLVSMLHEAVADVENRLSDIVNITNIFHNDVFIGVSFNDEKLLKQLKPKIELFATEMQKHGANVRVKPEPTSHYHISLAYGTVFDQNIKQQLMNLIDTVDVRSAFNEADWAIEIYCRKSIDQPAEEWMSESMEDLLRHRQ